MAGKQRIKPLFVANERWFDCRFDWSGLIWPGFLLALFIGFQWLLNKFGIYRHVAGMCILFTLYMLITFTGEQLERYSKGIDISLFSDKVGIRLWGSHYDAKTQLFIEPGSISSITAYQDFETRNFPGEIGEMKCNGTAAWKGWTAYFNSCKDVVSVVAIESTEYKLVLQCRNPTQVTDRMKEMYAVQGSVAPTAGVKRRL